MRAAPREKPTHLHIIIVLRAATTYLKCWNYRHTHPVLCVASTAPAATREAHLSVNPFSAPTLRKCATFTQGVHFLHISFQLLSRREHRTAVYAAQIPPLRNTREWLDNFAVRIIISCGAWVLKKGFAYRRVCTAQKNAQRLFGRIKRRTRSLRLDNT